MNNNYGKKVLMLGWELPPFYAGGLGVVSEGLAETMSKQGYDITFVLPKRLEYPQDYLKFKYADDYVDFKEDATTNGSDWNPYSRIIDNLDASGTFSNDTSNAPAGSLLYKVIQYARAVTQIADEESFDIIHAHDWLTFLAGVRAKQISGKPLVVHVHNTIYDRGLGNASPTERRIEKIGLEMADMVVPVSDFTGKIVCEKYNISSEKIKTIHNCIDIERYGGHLPHQDDWLQKLKDDGYKIVLSLGRTTIQKGLEYLVQAAKRVLEVDAKVYFIIAGDGDTRAGLMDLAARLGIADKVLFPGWSPRHHSDRYFQMADLFIMPSVSEPFGIVAIEAVARNTPVILSKTSGASEVIKGALTVDFWDTEKLASFILATLRDTTLQKQLKEHSRRDILKLTWDRAGTILSNIYKSITGTAKSSIHPRKNKEGTI